MPESSSRLCVPNLRHIQLEDHGRPSEIIRPNGPQITIHPGQSFDLGKRCDKGNQLVPGVIYNPQAVFGKGNVFIRQPQVRSILGKTGDRLAKWK